MTENNKTTPKRLDDFPAHLRGPSQNRWGGQRTQRLRGFQGNTYGPAGSVKNYSAEERKAWGAANGFPS